MLSSLKHPSLRTCSCTKDSPTPVFQFHCQLCQSKYVIHQPTFQYTKYLDVSLDWLLLLISKLSSDPVRQSLSLHLFIFSENRIKYFMGEFCKEDQIYRVLIYHKRSRLPVLFQSLHCQCVDDVFTIQSFCILNRYTGNYFLKCVGQRSIMCVRFKKLISVQKLVFWWPVQNLLLCQPPGYTSLVSWPTCGRSSVCIYHTLEHC